MAHISSTVNPALPENNAEYPENAVVVATANGLAQLPSRIRPRLANRWGTVAGVLAGTKDVLVHYPAEGSGPHQVEMVVPFLTDGDPIELIQDNAAVAAWRAQVLAGKEKRTWKRGCKRLS